MVHRNIKESLNLVGMQVNGDHTVCACRLQHVRYQLGADGHTRFVLAVLTCPTEIRNHSHHLVRTGTLRRIDHQQQLHQIVAGRTSGLHQINRLTANGLLKIGTELSIRETIQMDFTELAPQFVANTAGKTLTLGTCKDFKLIRLFHFFSWVAYFLPDSLAP